MELALVIGSGRLVAEVPMKPILALLSLLLASAALADAGVQVWEDTLTLPTYQEGPPDPNPPFDLFTGGNYFYPYTWRINFLRTATSHSWRALMLENEYLKCTVLPDLGGRLYSCLDKLSGRQMFYANSSVKKDWIALRGSWVALGMELNFPVGHSWVTVSPVDWAITENPDGSASAWVGNTDRVYGMQWRVEFVLRPGVAALEQRVTLHNRSDSRYRYYWWANAAVQVEDPTTTFIMPTRLAEIHGLPELITWPVSQGVDLSVTGNNTAQLGLFAFGCREEFFGVYHPTSRSGVVHYATLADAPGKKTWVWGPDGDAYVRSALSDNNTTYVEVQGGALNDQSTFAYLDPQQTRSFTEYWVPARSLGGITRANLYGILNLQRTKDSTGNDILLVEFSPSRVLSGATVRLWKFAEKVLDEMVMLDPASNYVARIRNPGANNLYAFQLLDADGRQLMLHAENQYDAANPSEYPNRHLPVPDYSVQKTEDDFLAVADANERNGNLVPAATFYQSGLAQFPSSARLLKAGGRLSVSMNRFQEGLDRLVPAQAALPGDPEIRYYLGVAHAGLGVDASARLQWEAIRTDPNWGPAASLQLACLLSRAGDYQNALTTLRSSFPGITPGIRAGAVEVALLRLLERWDEAAVRLRYWRSLDPADSALRHEQHRQGAWDPAFWHHLAADPERILDLATHYIQLGVYFDALLALARYYPSVDALESEPSAVAPAEHPLVTYYMAYCKEKVGLSGKDDYVRAATLSSRYIFPNRPGTLPVLQAALQRNSSDATAHYLLGSLYMSFQMVDQAIAEWSKARALRPDLPSLHRNLGRALLDVKKDPHAALPVLLEGLQYEPGNSDLQSALQRAQSLQ